MLLLQDDVRVVYPEKHKMPKKDGKCCGGCKNDGGRKQ